MGSDPNVTVFQYNGLYSSSLTHSIHLFSVIGLHQTVHFQIDQQLPYHLPFSSSFKWSCRNVIKKKGRSIPIAIATAIGLASAGLVLSMTKGVNDFVAQAQKEAIGDYPV